MIIPDSIKELFISELDKNLSLFDLSIEERQNLKKRLTSFSLPDEISISFFNHLLQFEDIKKILSDKDISYLKKKQKEYISSLFEFNLDEVYIKDRIRLANKHYKNNIDIVSFIGGYAKFAADIFRYLIQNNKDDVLPTLEKIFLFDVSIFSKIYLENAIQKSKRITEKYIDLYNKVNDGIIIIDVDNLKIVDVNKKIEDWLGLEKKQILNKDISFIFMEETKIKKLLKERYESYPILYLKSDRGTLIPVEISLSFSLNNGRLFAFSIVRNIRYRLELEKQIERLSILYRVLSKTNQLITTTKSINEFFSKIVEILVKDGKLSCSMIVLKEKEEKVSFLACNKEKDREKFFKENISFIEEVFEKRETCRKISDEGEKFIILIVYKNDYVKKENVCKAVLIVQSEEISFFQEEEINLLKEIAWDLGFVLFSLEKNKKIHFLEYYDAITKLPNRKYFFNILENFIKNEQSFALVILDIKHFKEINESISFTAGDIILKSLAIELENLLKGKYKLLARIGGDEFGIIIDGKTKEEVINIIKNLLEKIQQRPFKIEGQDIFISLNIGISFYPEDGNSAEELIAASEAALKEAKKIGKNICEVYNPLLKKEYLEQIELENDLRNGILNGEFRLFYQPIYSLREEKIIGAEALLRWFSPKRGYVPPLYFIHILEESGLIYDVGGFIIETAVKQLKQWEKYGIYISINISPYQLKTGNLHYLVEHHIDKNNVDPSKLVLELTETVIMENLEQAQKELGRLKDIGINVAIDDFGTGYSSLSYLKSLPFTSLKIDRSFIKDIPEDESSIKISKAIINLAHSLDKEVIAEGIETENQKNLLKSLDCDYAQGYLFSKPIPAEEFEKLL